MKKQKLLLTGLLAVIMLTGCGNPLKKVDANTIYLKEDASVSSVAIESFDKEIYDKDELQSFLDDEVNAYNSSKNDSKAVLVNKLEVKDNKALLMMDFKTVDDYNAFNGAEHKIGSISDFTIDSPVILAKTKKETALADLPDAEKLKVAYVKEPDIKNGDAMQVIVEGKVVAYSEGCELMSKKMVKTPNGQEGYIIYQ